MTLAQHPAPGSFSIYRCGDLFNISLHLTDETLTPHVRTSLGGAKKQRESLLLKTEHDKISSRNNWRDLPLKKEAQNKYIISLPLYQTGLFEAKIFFKKAGDDKVIWASGENIHIKVEPASTLINNSIYGIFTRQFGPNKNKAFALDEDAEILKMLDAKGYHVIPPSGTFRNVKKELDHIMGDMGFRILQLLPIHPTPTTFARMGRFGSPYAALDFFSVNSSLAEFDKQATPLDQFIELVDEVHKRQGELYLDIPVDHTGWASVLQKEHPEYFVKDNEGNFVSPGAWGTTWEDLVKLNFNLSEVHQMMADVFLYWCGMGVDGFRCDAGYMIPFDAWEYIIAKVRMAFPDTIFLLEGLGGPPETTEYLLSKATFSWAYSELFQNYSKDEVNHYITNMLRITYEKGGLVNFSETHDNSRLAATSEKWSYMRNLINALTAPAGAFGISNGVEFFAKEKISVHHASGLNWDNTNNLIPLFKKITTLYTTHPAFDANAKIEVVFHNYPQLFLSKRKAANGDELLIVVNLNCDKEVSINLKPFLAKGDIYTDLITNQIITTEVKIGAGQAYCIDNTGRYSDKDIANTPHHSQINLQQAKSCVLHTLAKHQGFGHVNSNTLTSQVENLLVSPIDFCLSIGFNLGQIIQWDVNTDYRRHVMAPHASILYMYSQDNFDFTLKFEGQFIHHGKAIKKDDHTYFALIPTPSLAKEKIEYLDIQIKSHLQEGTIARKGQIALLPKKSHATCRQAFNIRQTKSRELAAFCSNPSGTMAQLSGIWGEFNSKYDSFFAVNLDPMVPVDRTALLSRVRCWVVYNDFSHELSEKSQYLFAANGADQATWSFKAPTGQGEFILLDIHLKMSQTSDQITLFFQRKEDPDHADLLNTQVPVQIIIRPDLEYRSNHEVTKAFLGAETLYPKKITTNAKGFTFHPYQPDNFAISSDKAVFIQETEWHYMHHLSVESDRGLECTTDLFSPGYFNSTLVGNDCLHLYATTEKQHQEEHSFIPIPAVEENNTILKRSLQKFIVRRDEGQTVIAGYPWFLDWGRDTLICLRGIIAADMQKEARDILLTFAKYEKEGTLPNMIRGNNASNRDTSDAPLWFIVAVKDYVEHFADTSVLNMDCAGRTLKEILLSIAENYAKGTTNGIKMDSESGLIYSPSHFTWMDTNYPADTPREGYPIEIQAFWSAALNYISTLTSDLKWTDLADKVKASIHHYYPLSGTSGCADCFHTNGYQPIKNAKKDNACRPNQLFLITLGVISDSVLIKSILIATQSLIMPGAIRSLKDAPVKPPLSIYRDGHLLNNPEQPYWGNYTGDEDTRRKPAYHNGTGWAWPFFSYCEALFLHTKDNITSLAILMSAQQEMEKGIINHMPEVCDGNAPHAQRGCGAQAWSITEFYRVLNTINRHTN